MRHHNSEGKEFKKVKETVERSTASVNERKKEYAAKVF